MPRLIIRKSRIPNSGFGLFTLDDIPRGGRIVEYAGRRRKWRDVKHLDGVNGYLLRLNRSTAIDARPLNSGKGRYANDAAKIAGYKSKLAARIPMPKTPAQKKAAKADAGPLPPLPGKLGDGNKKKPARLAAVSPTLSVALFYLAAAAVVVLMPLVLVWLSNL